MLNRSNNTAAVKRVRTYSLARRVGRRLLTETPIVKVARKVRTPAARYAFDYRQRRAATIGTGKRMIKTPKKIIPLELSDALIMTLVADPRFVPPPAGSSDYAFRKAVGAVAEAILKASK